MHKYRYRYPSSIKWGPNYNASDQMHHTKAVNFKEAREKIPSCVESAQIQVYDGVRWKFAEITPHCAGGYDRGRYSPEG